MTYSQTIALDAMGGDHGPDVIVPGAAQALAVFPDIRFLFYGDEAKILPVLEKFPLLRAVSAVHHTDKKISSSDSVSSAIRASKDSSMRLAIEAVKDGKADSVVSAGNTGALMALSKMILKTLPGIERPAIASVMPNANGSSVVLDLGANLECDASVLVQFAMLGAVYARVVKGISTPTVGLLNVGTEELKGHEEVREAAAILSSVKFHGKYHGFVEGNDITKGTVDVIVTDGFSGNIALKTAEGVGKLTSQFLKDAFKSSPLAMLGYFFASGAMKKLKSKLDPSKYNGGMFLGLGGVAVKSHGGSNIDGTANAILVAANLVKGGFNARVAAEIQEVMAQMDAQKQSESTAAQ
ncbi:MAG: phosphate acyltransferase PlsX [Micavibrio aeruginosavorus]|uniref:Phosphate acyltransferase n=1 Tax=Micavibrio aeruginosavorus TaxID=349221 RepID=A0A2W5MTV7_9BACT|nr:MAG: phosphate acyltransferase PlsX [Micavibrio aeruginosavorus]